MSHIEKALRDGVKIREAILSDSVLLKEIEKAASALVKASKSGGTIYACGNGGSACDAMHFVEELVARYKKERPGIKAMHFLDGATISCWTNDYDFDSVFKRQVETFCTEKDILVGFSTSGNSKNVILAFEAARKRKTPTIGLLGRDGGALKALSDIALIVPSQETERIQEIHITLVHIFCEILES